MKASLTRAQDLIAYFVASYHPALVMEEGTKGVGQYYTDFVFSSHVK